MTDKTTETIELEAFFDAARDADPMPSGALLARIEADALAALPVNPGLAEAREPDVKQGIWAQLLDLVGGWTAVSGLAAAAAAGLWIGVSPPVAVSDGLSDFLGDNAELLSSGDLDPYSGFEYLLAEG